MCIVIDVNNFSRVFMKSSKEHANYKPVLKWFVSGKGKMVVGGTKYWHEISKMRKYLGIINQLNRAGKLVKIDDVKIDKKTNALKKLCNDKNFDDPHIVALLIVSGCNLLCSEDNRSYPYVTKKKWYPKGTPVPKIYRKTTFKNASRLLSDKNIADICKPCAKTTKNNAKLLKKI